MQLKLSKSLQGTCINTKLFSSILFNGNVVSNSKSLCVGHDIGNTKPSKYFFNNK